MTIAEAVWTAYKTLLEAQKYDKWIELWADDGELVVAYGKAAAPFLEEIHRGKEEIYQLIAGGGNRIKTGGVKFSNDKVHETKEESIFFTIFNLRMETIDASPYTYDNHIACEFILAEG